MTFDEALALKKSLKSDSFITVAGKELKIFIAPEDLDALKVYKSALKYNWTNLKDSTARQYTLADRFILYGIRILKNGSFSGGALDLNLHRELLENTNN